MSSCSVSHPYLHVACDAAVGPLRLQIDETITADWTVLFGPSGSGKSTLLRLIAGLWSPPSSKVQRQDEDLSLIPAWKRGIALVAQRPALFLNMSVAGNVAFGCKDKTENAATRNDLLDAFDLQPLREKSPSRLSGGEQQRVALARALAARPKMLLLDEAFTGMHRSQQARLMDMVRALCAERQTPVLSVTHDVAEAFRGDEVLRMEAGRIVARGTAMDVLAEERAATLQSLNAADIHQA